MGNVLKGAACVVVLSSLAGCGALDPVNMILSARASSYDMVAEMTSPEMRNITVNSLRSANCQTLSGMGPLYQEDLKKATAKGDRVEIAVAEMNISVVKQIQAEKSCPVAPPLQTKAPASTAITGAAGGSGTAGTAASSAARITQGSLDITVDSVSPSLAKSLGMTDLKGALVVDTKKGSAADKAGIKPLDVILEVNGQPVNTPTEFSNIVGRMRPGYKAPLRVFRSGKTRNVTVVVSKEERPIPTAVAPAVPDPDTAPSMTSPLLADHGWMGMQYVMGAKGLIEDIPPSLATSLGLEQTRGVLMGGAIPNGASDKAGLKTLDVILSLNGRPLESRTQLTELLARLPGGAPVKLGVWRNRKLEFVPVTLGSQALQLTLPTGAEGYCFAWVNANAALKNGAISYEFVVPAADAVEDINPTIGAQFRATMVERGLGPDLGAAPGYAVCRKTREAILKAREEATTALRQTFAATGKDTFSVYWVPR
ncbi:PDZ domain-containing protein [Herbaspirillum rhizosphaerae]|uniref:PDZ domain-containing protein n=1 Tax=Herbaspirillum rhizosphaerae TaxID=346179 RepID=A0ABW8Z769_9BURK